MLERYEEAGNNNLEYIKELLESDPAAIDLPFDGTENFSRMVKDLSLTGLKIMTVGGASAAFIALLPLSILGATVALCAEGISLDWLMQDADKKSPKNKVGWTLLEFAAEGNATQVAAYLILNKANLDNDFINIAIKNNHHDFVKRCKKLIKQRFYSLSDIKRCNILTFDAHVKSGAYGDVYTGTIENHEDKVAIKDIILSAYQNKDDCRKEINIMNFLTLNKAPHVVKFIGFEVWEKRCLIAMEYMKNGNLLTFIANTKKHFQLSQIIGCVRDIGCALEFMHSYAIVHRDLKLNNILLDDNYKAVLCDFGLAVRLDIDELDTDKCVAFWRAPEVMMHGEIGLEGDIYSLAFVTWSLVTLEALPFKEIEIEIETKHDEIIREKILVNNERPFLPKNTDPKLHKLICTMWATKPQDRFTATQVLNELGEIARSSQIGFSKK